jgi:homoserine/homoserine lactone efflux protein
MSTELLVGFLVMTTVSSFVPGPSVLFVVSQSIWRGPRGGLAAGAGIQVANMLYFLLTGLGLASVIAMSGTVFTVLKWVGAAYLAWLGVTAIIASFRPHEEQSAFAGKPAANGFRDGFIVAASNPKSLLYFIALLPQFIRPDEPVLMQAMVLGVIACAIDFAADACYAFAGSALARSIGRPGVRKWFERGIGGLFLSLAATTALYRRVA